jgi:hypothetical protein
MSVPRTGRSEYHATDKARLAEQPYTELTYLDDNILIYI